MQPANAFFDALEKSGLFAPAEMERIRRQIETESTASSGDEIAQLLQKQRYLTKFQSKQLVAGRYRGFFIAEKYKILDLLGEGGMGRVLLCEHMLMRRLVAVKLMQVSVERHASAVDRFLREARAAASLHHRNIAQVFDVDRSERGPYIVMEYVDGVDLHRYTTRKGPLPVEQAVNFIRQAAAGLQHAHEAGLVHRDVKPLNLMLDRAGSVKLLDLGLARFFDSDKDDKLTQQHDVSAILGTADFIAPEQAMESSTADIRADIYSLGLTLYYLLSGKLPFGPAKGIQKLLWHQVREPEPICNLRPEVPEELAAVLNRMIRKSPEERFATPTEASAALEPWGSDGPAPPSAAELPPSAASSYRLGISPVNKPTKAVTTTSPSSVDPGAQSVAGRASALHAAGPQSDVRPASQALLDTRKPAQAMAATPTTPKPKSWMEEELAAAPTSVPKLAPIRPASKPDRRRLLLATGAVGCVLLVAAVGITARLVFWRGAPSAHASNSALMIAGGFRDGESPSPSPAAPTSSVMLHGGGSTFVRPVMDRWTQLYQAERGVRVEYVPVGSTKGVDGMTSKVLDFGCTDAYLSDAQLEAAGGKLVHVPLTMGAVVAAYNVPLEDPSARLRFTGPVLAQIYLGRITKWNDPAIAVNNPGLKLPDLAITPVYRSDGSGTTSIWTEYLGKSDSTWKESVGVGTKVNWPVGKGAEKNDGIADAVSRTTGAVGYVELSFAMANGLAFGNVKNAAGQFVVPSIDSVTAAAAALLKEIPADMRFSLTDAPGAASYPIVGTAWAVLYAQQPYGKGKELAEFLLWATSEGQAHVGDLHYGRLPDEMTEMIRRSLSDMSAGR